MALVDQLAPGNGWREHLAVEFEQPYMQRLSTFLTEEQAAGKVVYPAHDEVFRALNSTPLGRVEVVILGQDPYHGPGQAHGLCFSVPPGVAPPPSLVNIYKELQADVGAVSPDHGCLQPWTEQGVLLLNSVLTVTRGQAAAHQGKGWETFTDQVVQLVNRQCEGVVFLLWGNYARNKGRTINRNRHCVLEGSHPSPLSAYRGFFGCRHFSQANAWLEQQGKSAIVWQLPPQHELSLVTAAVP